MVFRIISSRHLVNSITDWYSRGIMTSEVDTTRAILGTIGDTTWRMFVPSIGFTLLGVWLDGMLSTKPWLMFGGIVLGLGLAVLLVKRQIDEINCQKKSEERSK